MVQSFLTTVKSANLALVRLLFLVLFLSGCGSQSESEFQQFVKRQECLTASQIYQDYQRNEVAAQQKYTNKIIRVCGIVDEIELNWLDNPVISLEVPGWGYLSVGGIDATTAARMQKGNIAVFECKEIHELLGDPVLTGCNPAYTKIPNSAESAPGPEVSTPREQSVAPPLSSEFQAINNQALILGRDFVDGGGDMAWQSFDAAFLEVSTFKQKGIPFCHLEVTAHVSYSVPCGYQQNYLYIFTSGLQGIPFS